MVLLDWNMGKLVVDLEVSWVSSVVQSIVIMEDWRACGALRKQELDSAEPGRQWGGFSKSHRGKSFPIVPKSFQLVKLLMLQGTWFHFMFSDCHG